MGAAAALRRVVLGITWTEAEAAVAVRAGRQAAAVSPQVSLSDLLRAAQVLGDLVSAAADGLQPSLARGLLVAVVSALTRVLLDGGPQRCGPQAPRPPCWIMTDTPPVCQASLTSGRGDGLSWIISDGFCRVCRLFTVNDVVALEEDLEQVSALNALPLTWLVSRTPARPLLCRILHTEHKSATSHSSTRSLVLDTSLVMQATEAGLSFEPLGCLRAGADAVLGGGRRPAAPRDCAAVRPAVGAAGCHGAGDRQPHRQLRAGARIGVVSN